MGKLEEFGECKNALVYWRTKVNPESKEARILQVELQKATAAAKEKNKKTFGSMFKKDLYTEKANVKKPRDMAKMPKVYIDFEITKPVAVPEDQEEAEKEAEEGDAKTTKEVKRVEFALYQDTVPKTVENFRQLCTGENENKALTFKDSPIHRLIPGFMLQGGDITKGDGTGGESIYGEKFADENLTGPDASPDTHVKRGQLSMANAGPNTNGSQFFVTFGAASHLDGKHVLFGEVINGMEVLDEIEGMEM